METLDLAIIFLTSIVASTYGALVGGGSFLMVPTLIFLGIPPHTAIASNRAGFLGLFFPSIYKFHQKKLINWKIGWAIGVPAFLGAYFGAHFLFQVDEELLKKLIGIVALLVLICVILKKEIGMQSRTRKTHILEYILGGIFAFGAGFLGSLVGGVGTYLSYILLLFFGQTFLESAGTRKIAGLLIAAMATTVFISKGAVDYQIAGILFAGTWVGAYIGAHYSEQIGNLWTRRGFIIIVGIMSIKLIF